MINKQKFHSMGINWTGNPKCEWLTSFLGDWWRCIMEAGWELHRYEGQDGLNADSEDEGVHIIHKGLLEKIYRPWSEDTFLGLNPKQIHWSFSLCRSRRAINIENNVPIYLGYLIIMTFKIEFLVTYYSLYYILWELGHISSSDKILFNF